MAKFDIMKVEDLPSGGTSGDPDPGQGQRSPDDSPTASGQETTDNASLKGHLAPIVAAILVLLLYLPTLIWLVRSWLHNPYYSHGFLVPPVSMVIAWARRESLKREKPSKGAFLALAVGAGMFITAFAWDVSSLSAVSLVMVLAGLIWVFYGFKAIRAMAFPIGFLLFMIPFPYYNDIAFRLQNVSVHSCTWLLHVLGLPITTAGSEITLGDATFSIGLTCGGLNILVALAALTAVFAYLLDGPAYKRVILLALSVPLALLANALRIVSIVLVAHYYDVGFATGFYHDNSSLPFFILASLCLILIARIAGCRLRIRQQRDRPRK